MKSISTKKKNILFIISRSDIGGGPRHLHNLLEFLKNEEGIIPFVACPKKGEFFESFNKLAKDVHIIGFRSFSLIQLISLHLFCRNNNISLIHSHGRGAGLW